jgi:hypothetical protein
MSEERQQFGTEQVPAIILEEVSDPRWQADFFCVSLDMIGHLPGLVRSSKNGRVQVACFEAFLVHVRLIAEFLARPSKDKDFTARDFLSPLSYLWPRPSTDAGKRLRDKHWLTASKHVVHFSKDRVPADLADVKPIDPSEYMSEAASDVFAVAEDFVSAVERAGHGLAGMLRGALNASRTAFEEGSR